MYSLLKDSSKRERERFSPHLFWRTLSPLTETPVTGMKSVCFSVKKAKLLKVNRTTLSPLPVHRNIFNERFDP